MTIVRSEIPRDVPSVRRSSDRLFYAAASLAIIASVFVGFAPTYYLRSRFFPTPLPLLLHVHGVVFTAWILLFVTQTMLVAGRRVDLHRRLGVAGAALAALLVIVGLTTALVAARRNFAAGNEGALTFLTIPFGDMLVFGMLAGAGIRYRRRSDVHKRLMLLAAVSILREQLPELKIRVVNIVDLMKLEPATEHPHGLSDPDFDSLFTKDKPVIFAFHGYPSLIHGLTYKRTNHHNLHVRGYMEEGTITTPFDMTVLNGLDRFHLVQHAVERVPQLSAKAAYLKQMLQDKLIEHKEYIDQYGQDLPEIRNWKWRGKQPVAARRSVLGEASTITCDRIGTVLFFSTAS